ncbi:hypothetical protein [Nocardiopsis ansamitocini]|uniref:Uncharacterized protein n=1 Tax=Nocardiopsis ansamitocini TaxID=1670832 RepID=A0A9W6UIX3_9ACTN|nr:hypothetical protein [Nocardiopsis ansamitocini]GLU50356.1 hypothetical protein Nans01_47070 [Nocardiopsis ansamitocini]
MQSQKFTHPWRLLSGAIAGGLAWAIGLPVYAAVVIGVIVWLTAVVVFGYLFSQPGDIAAGQSPHGLAQAAPAHPDAACATRAHEAAVAFEELAAPLFTGPLSETAHRMVWRVNEIADSIEHLVERSAEIAHRVSSLVAHPGGYEQSQYLQGRHGEVRHRMYAATDDLEAATGRFRALLSTRPDPGAVEHLAGELESIGYGVDIGEQIADGVLGTGETPPGQPTH